MRHLTTASLLLLSMAGCTADGGSTTVTSSEADDLVIGNGKADTGYYSSLATELEGTFRGRLELDVTEENRAATDTEEERIALAEEQLKFSKNQLNGEKLHLNLTAEAIHDVQLSEDESHLIITYTARIETIVTNKDLTALGIEDAASLTNRELPFRVPADARTMFTRVGETCATGFDAGDLRDDNYFYYFDPAKQGCAVPLTDGTFTINALAPRSNTYPEYDRLIADNEIRVAVFFGAADHEETVSEWDWGMREHRDFVAMLVDRGFAEDGAADSNSGKGKHFTRERGGLTEIVDVISPRDLKALKDDQDGIFVRLVQSHEIVLYNGHSFYGSLRGLNEAATYPADTYQIFFMNSCWSYEYYTRQIFKAKQTADDPTGWALADVVNDTESGWFHNMEDYSRILLTNIFDASEKVKAGEDVTAASWPNIIGRMNEHSLNVYDEGRGGKTHEIMGVSGVRTNSFDPANVNGGDVGGDPIEGGEEPAATAPCGEGSAIGDRSCDGQYLTECTESGWTQIEDCGAIDACFDGACQYQYE